MVFKTGCWDLCLPASIIAGIWRMFWYAGILLTIRLQALLLKLSGESTLVNCKFYGFLRQVCESIIIQLILMSNCMQSCPPERGCICTWVQRLDVEKLNIFCVQGPGREHQPWKLASWRLWWGLCWLAWCGRHKCWVCAAISLVRLWWLGPIWRRPWYLPICEYPSIMICSGFLLVYSMHKQYSLN